ncbi:hypothetical protein BDP27DRAFT_1370041 [Rhodocollybia butyracea]|uniref:Uncharacterized protein n=1 Tax=Rhodocollybia butyracea TaxID=206335 RepID=A0A9P5TZN5_9AGAR|nr:hypothetical protein BDP27DRAFT_1370041 [Rhodocollybia butyracea]
MVFGINEPCTFLAKAEAIALLQISHNKVAFLAAVGTATLVSASAVDSYFISIRSKSATSTFISLSTISVALLLSTSSYAEEQYKADKHFSGSDMEYTDYSARVSGGDPVTLRAALDARVPKLGEQAISGALGASVPVGFGTLDVNIGGAQGPNGQQVSVGANVVTPIGNHGQAELGARSMDIFPKGGGDPFHYEQAHARLSADFGDGWTGSATANIPSVGDPHAQASLSKSFDNGFTGSDAQAGLKAGLKISLSLQPGLEPGPSALGLMRYKPSMFHYIWVYLTIPSIHGLKLDNHNLYWHNCEVYDLNNMFDKALSRGLSLSPALAGLGPGGRPGSGFLSALAGAEWALAAAPEPAPARTSLFTGSVAADFHSGGGPDTRVIFNQRFDDGFNGQFVADFPHDGDPHARASLSKDFNNGFTVHGGANFPHGRNPEPFFGFRYDFD